jgi:hypothetical protein
MNKTKFFVVIGLIIIIALIVIGYQWGANTALKGQMKGIVEASDRVAATIEKSIQERDVRAATAEKKADEALKESKETKEKLAKNEKVIASLKDRLESAAPEELVTATRRLLETQEVWYSAERKEATFSLAAFRIDAIKLSIAENFTLVKEPRYQKLITDFELAASGHKVAIAELRGELKEKDIKYVSLEDSFREYRKTVEKIKKPGFFDTILKVGGGAGIAFVIFSLTK